MRGEPNSPLQIADFNVQVSDVLKTMALLNASLRLLRSLPEAAQKGSDNGHTYNVFLERFDYAKNILTAELNPEKYDFSASNFLNLTINMSPETKGVMDTMAHYLELSRHYFPTIKEPLKVFKNFIRGVFELIIGEHTFVEAMKGRFVHADEVCEIDIKQLLADISDATAENNEQLAPLAEYVSVVNLLEFSYDEVMSFVDSIPSVFLVLPDRLATEQFDSHYEFLAGLSEKFTDLNDAIDVARVQLEAKLEVLESKHKENNATFKNLSRRQKNKVTQQEKRQAVVKAYGAEKINLEGLLHSLQRVSFHIVGSPMQRLTRYPMSISSLPSLDPLTELMGASLDEAKNKLQALNSNLLRKAQDANDKGRDKQESDVVFDEAPESALSSMSSSVLFDSMSWDKTEDLDFDTIRSQMLEDYKTSKESAEDSSQVEIDEYDSLEEPDLEHIGEAGLPLDDVDLASGFSTPTPEINTDDLEKQYPPQTSIIKRNKGRLATVAFLAATTAVGGALAAFVLPIVGAAALTIGVVGIAGLTLGYKLGKGLLRAFKNRKDELNKDTVLRDLTVIQTELYKFRPSLKKGALRDKKVAKIADFKKQVALAPEGTEYSSFFSNWFESNGNPLKARRSPLGFDAQGTESFFKYTDPGAYEMNENTRTVKALRKLAKQYEGRTFGPSPAA